MKRFLIFGNSGSGKTTLAKRLMHQYKLAHLDLDNIAWDLMNSSKRRNLQESNTQINAFMKENEQWVIEGCYTDLLNFAIKKTNEIIFLNPGIETCLNNCRARPWEPHKYETSEQQNNNLDLLLDWVIQYPTRTDTFSMTEHRKLYDHFTGNKTEYNKNYPEQ